MDGRQTVFCPDPACCQIEWHCLSPLDDRVSGPQLIPSLFCQSMPLYYLSLENCWCGVKREIITSCIFSNWPAFVMEQIACKRVMWRERDDHTRTCLIVVILMELGTISAHHFLLGQINKSKGYVPLHCNVCKVNEFSIRHGQTLQINLARCCCPNTLTFSSVRKLWPYDWQGCVT